MPEPPVSPDFTQTVPLPLIDGVMQVDTSNGVRFRLDYGPQGGRRWRNFEPRLVIGWDRTGGATPVTVIHGAVPAEGCAVFVEVDGGEHYEATVLAGMWVVELPGPPPYATVRLTGSLSESMRVVLDHERRERSVRLPPG